MATRRHVLALLASTPFAASSCAPANLPDPVAAWRSPGAGESDPRRFALAHAILAPNPHNRQPWLVDLVGDDELVLSVDLERLLPATDPYSRQIVLGCGAFLELFDLACRANNQRAEITLWPEGEPIPHLDARPVARIRLVAEQINKDALFDQILNRRTNREPYEPRPVDDAVFAEIARQTLSPLTPPTGETGDVSPPPAPAPLRIEWTASGDALDALRALAWNGFDREIRTPPAYQESVDLMRIGREEIARHRDGLVLDGPMIEFAKAVGLLNHETLADLENRVTRDGIEAFRPLAMEAPAFAWLTSRDNTRFTQVMSGRAYARFNLAATGAGLAMHPWSQTLQEYPEMADLFSQAERLTGAREGETVQMLVRAGYGPRIGPAPRRGLSEHLRG
ncbi:MAG: nitroreductase family protein [Hyphomonadaceae bacterium]|nr:nitroreductase family protein [Hyphomonadaceae bacterium]